MMDVADLIYALAGMCFGFALAWYIFWQHPEPEQTLEMVPPLARQEPRFTSVWRQRGYDDYMLDGTNDPARAPEGYARTEYNLGHDIALAESRKVWDDAMADPEAMPRMMSDGMA